jgi:hypothetical protein
VGLSGSRLSGSLVIPIAKDIASTLKPDVARIGGVQEIAIAELCFSKGRAIGFQTNAYTKFC